MKRIILCLFFVVSLNNYVHSQKTGITKVNYGDTKSSFFTVKAQGETLEAAEFKDIHYVSFIQNGELNVSITCKEEIKSYVISPLNKQLKGNLVKPNELQFQLKEPSYLVITINDNQRLFMFAELSDYKDSDALVNINSYNLKKGAVNTKTIQEAINKTAAKKQTLFFPPGIYKTGKLEIPSNTKIFMAPGAVLKASDDIADLRNDPSYRTRGFIRIQDATNVEIKGLGVIDGNGRVLREKYADDARFRIFMIVSSKKVSIEGITARDPGSWNTQIMYSDNVSFNRVKLLNDASLSNTDGFDPDASSNVTIENCFAYCGDDNVAIKVTRDDGPVNKTSNITVKGCVFLTRKSSLKVGTESRGASISNVLFEDNDVIMSDRGMALYCSDGATYENIRYINNRFETNYPDAKRMGIQFVINKRNPGSKAGIMKNIFVKDNKFYSSFPAESQIRGLNNTNTIDVKIENLEINGEKRSTLTEARIKAEFAKVTIE